MLRKIVQVQLFWFLATNFRKFKVVKNQTEIGLDFIVDKLTNSIENVITGDSFATDISILTTTNLKVINKKKGWVFNWKEEFKDPLRDIYKLTIVNNS